MLIGTKCQVDLATGMIGLEKSELKIVLRKLFAWFLKFWNELVLPLYLVLLFPIVSFLVWFSILLTNCLRKWYQLLNKECGIKIELGETELVELNEQEELDLKVQKEETVSVLKSEDTISPLMTTLAAKLSSLPDKLVGGGSQGSISEPSKENLPLPTNEPDHAELLPYLSYGEQLYSEGKYEEAIPYIHYVAELDPTNAQVIQILGHCYYGLGFMNEALQCYEVASSLVPEDEEALKWLEQFRQTAGV